MAKTTTLLRRYLYMFPSGIRNSGYFFVAQLANKCYKNMKSERFVTDGEF
jgi:hypothetical protein